VRLLGFKYLHKQRILTLVLILTLTSTLFSVTALGFLGLYNGFNAYLGEGEDIVAIYGRASQTPFSGLVPLYLAERMSSINGVLASSPEVIAPAVVKGESIFIRGIVTEEFSKLNTLTMVEGEMLDQSDANFAIVGKGLSERLSLKLGDKVLVLGVLAEEYIELQIKGIYESQSTMDDEALVPLYVGQWLRATDYSHVTLIRVKIDKGKANVSELFEEIAKEASQPSTSEGEGENPLEGIIPFVKSSFKLEDVGVNEAQKFMQSYLDRYGVTKETLIVLSIMVLIFASATAACALTMFIHQHKHEIEIIRSVGASEKKIKVDLLVKVLSWSFVSSTLGIILATAILMAFERIGYLQVLSHRILFQPDPLTIALNFTLISLLVAIGIAHSDVKR
jgi:ABC-type lipoprotein release transport system permease subunit